MNKKYRLFTALMFLPLLLTIISILFLPSQVPVQYGGAGQKAPQMESRFILLILPFFMLGGCAFLKVLLMEDAKYSKNPNSKTPLYTFAGIVIFCNLLQISSLVSVFLAVNHRKLFSLPKLSEQTVLALSCFGIGIFMIVIGIVCFFRKKPSGFYANIEAPAQNKVLDIPRYNRAVGKLFLFYSIPFFISGLLSYQDKMTAIIMLTLTGMPGCIILMIIYECVIDKKYILHP